MKTLKIILITVLVAIGLAVGSVTLGLFGLGSHVVNNAGQTAHGVIDKTLNADNAIFNYENYKDMHENAKRQVENIKASQTQIDSVKATYGEDAKTYPKDVREQLALSQQNIQGYTQMYNSIVSEYNANSKKLNRTLFKDKSLPYELPLNYKDFQ